MILTSQIVIFIVHANKSKTNSALDVEVDTLLLSMNAKIVV